MPDDLSSRVRAAIQETIHVAEKARDVGGQGAQTWHAGFHDSDIYTRPHGTTIIAGQDGLALDWAVLNHILRNNPDAVIRRCEADLRTVDRHHVVEIAGCVDGCARCGGVWPCPDLLDRATAYGVEVGT